MERINGRFAPGVSGNPPGLPGRPLGSRQAFSQGFLNAHEALPLSERCGRFWF
jgi:hypothetical protein